MTATALPPRATLARDDLSHTVLALCAHTERVTRQLRDAGRPAPMLDAEPAPLNLTWALSSLDAFGLIQWYGTPGAWDIAGVTPLGDRVLTRWEQQLFGGQQ